MSRNPRELDHAEAAALLLPKRHGLGSLDIEPWEPWTRPHASKPIDDEVAKQIERTARRRAPHMRTRAELDAIGIWCPYAHARLAVAFAAGDGTHDLLENQAAKPAPVGRGRSAQLKEYAAEATDLIDRLGTFLKHSQGTSWELGFSHRPFSARDDLNETNARLRRVNGARDQVEAAREALRVLAEAALEKKEQLTPSHSTGDLWRQAFVMRMGVAWRSLTGSDPSPSSDHFRRFVAAGFNSLGPGIPTDATEWRHHVTTACERMAKRPEWDRWDREERDTDPPGTRRISADEWQARQAERIDRFERDVLAYAEAEDEGARRAALMQLVTAYSFLPNAPGNPEKIQAIVTRRREASGPGLVH